MPQSRHKTCLLWANLLSISAILTDCILASSSGDSRPNIVIVVADDLGSRDIGYPDSDIGTPYLDNLASQGVKMTNYYVQPTCAPTRSQLLTGRYEINTGVQLEHYITCDTVGMPIQYSTMADYLQQAGYSTNAVGKWGIGFAEKAYTPLYRGFDTFYGILTPHSNHFDYEYCDDYVFPDYCGYALLDGEVPDYGANGTYSATAFTSRATDIIRNSSKLEKPLFLYLAYTVPHFPLEAPDIYYNKYRNIANDERRVYAGMVSALDEGVKNITRALVEAGMWENTVFIFFGDNGGTSLMGGLNWPLRGQKSGWWEGGIKNNAFVTSLLLPEGRRGASSHGLMHVTDWLPTVAEIAGIELNESIGLDGFSQWGMIKDGDPSFRTEILHNIDEGKDLTVPRISNGTFNINITAAIRVGDFKLLTGEPGDATWYKMPSAEPENYASPDLDNKRLWLFNIARDPNELMDLSDQMPDKVNELLDRLLYYDKNAKPAITLEIDSRCNPSLNGGYWGPWVD